MSWILNFSAIRALPGEKIRIERSEIFRNPRVRNHVFGWSKRHRIRVLGRVLVSFEWVGTGLDVPDALVMLQTPIFMFQLAPCPGS